MAYSIGDRVERIESRASVLAIVVGIQEDLDGVILKLEYDEGGAGFWPSDSVRPAPPPITP